MLYPDWMVDRYTIIREVSDSIDKKLTEPFRYDLDDVVELEECMDCIVSDLLEEATVYAAETGADRDGGYDPDRVMDDLEAQYLLREKQCGV